MKEMYIAWNEWWIDLWFDHPMLFAAVIVLAIALAIWRSRLKHRIKW